VSEVGNSECYMPFTIGAI